MPTHTSELAAGIALYMLCADNEEGAEIYGCANDRQQAAIVFDVAREIVQQSPILRSGIRIIDSQKRMVYMPTHSIYQALSARWPASTAITFTPASLTSCWSEQP